MRRRDIVKLLLSIPVAGSLLRASLAWAEWNTEAFSAVKSEVALEKLFPGMSIEESKQITIGVHDLVENGAVVPVKINSDLAGVTSISIVVEKNPNPLIAHFELSPKCRAFVATRIKVGAPSELVAIVKSNGKLYKASKYVEVVEGGCS